MKNQIQISKKFSFDWIILGMAVLMIFYHMLSVWVPMFNALLHQNVHLGFAFVMLFLVAIRSSKSWQKAAYVGLLLIAVGIVVFMHVENERLHMWAGFPEGWDVAVGIGLVLLVFFLTWRNWGGVFPIMVSITILYALYGHHLGGYLGHGELDPQLVLSNLGIGFTGIYGMMLNASVNLVFLFIIFGGLFEAVGIGRFFLEVGNYLGGRLRGGAAQTAVFSSSFVGMCTGGAAANVALTGSYTIPLMKKTGYEGKYAGAIEAMASTGGQLTPPVMGVSIFLMASFLGISYGALMTTALIPAIMFYMTAVFGVILIATKNKLPMLEGSVDRSILLQGFPLFVFPIGLVTVMLLLRYTPGYAAFFAIWLLLGIAMLRKETRPTLKDFLLGITRGAVMGSTIAIACACIGMFTAMLTFTGAGPKLAGLIEVLAGDNLIMGLILTMVLSILLGCAMPSAVAYIVVALVVAPVLENMGLTLLTAHFFVFYYAILSSVTPPVAGGALIGSRIAESDYMATGWEAFKLVAPFFLIPFFLVKNPVIMSMNQPFWSAVLAIIALLISWSSFMFFCQGYLLNKIHWFARAGFLAASLSGVYYGQHHKPAYLVFSVIAFIILIVLQWLKRVAVDEIPLATG